MNVKLLNIKVLSDNIIICIKKDSKSRPMKIRSSWINNMRNKARFFVNY